MQVYILKKIKDADLADLLGKMLDPDPTTRISSTRLVLDHPFFDIVVDCNASGSSIIIQQSISNIYTSMHAKRTQVSDEEFFFDSVGQSMRAHLEKLDKILRQTVYYFDKCSLTPVNFVILNRNLKQSGPASKPILSWVKKLSYVLTMMQELRKLPYFFDCENCINVQGQDGDNGDVVSDRLATALSNVTNAIRELFSEDSEFWIYFYDEFTLRLVDRPILIQPVEVIPRILAVFHLSLRAVAATGGIKAVSEVLGFFISIF